MPRPPGVRVNPHALQWAREVRGLSQADVATRAGLKSMGHYSEIESGKTRPSNELLIRIAKALEASDLIFRLDLPSQDVEEPAA